MSESCCPTPNQSVTDHSRPSTCPQNGTQGPPVDLITLKSLLRGAALMQLEPQQTYRFCPDTECLVVYFSQAGQTFMTTDLKVPVFQKDSRAEVSVCYCFEWTRQRIGEEIERNGSSSAIASIKAQIKAKRCGCEVNNPQGHCCLGNVRQVVEQEMENLKGG